MPKLATLQAECPIQLLLFVADAVYIGKAVPVEEFFQGQAVAHMDKNNFGSGFLDSTAGPRNVPEGFAAKGAPGVTQEYQ